MSFFASSSLKVLKRIRDFVKNHKPSKIAKSIATMDISNAPVKLNTSSMDMGIKNNVYIKVFDAVFFSFTPDNILNPALV